MFPFPPNGKGLGKYTVDISVVFMTDVFRFPPNGKVLGKT